jgi:hypothetical protein
MLLLWVIIHKYLTTSFYLLIDMVKEKNVKEERKRKSRKKYQPAVLFGDLMKELKTVLDEKSFSSDSEMIRYVVRRYIEERWDEKLSDTSVGRLDRTSTTAMPADIHGITMNGE